jgi:hypothetical protein
MKSVKSMLTPVKAESGTDYESEPTDATSAMTEEPEASETAEKKPQTTPTYDPFDPRRLRVSSDFAGNLGGGVKKQRNIVPVRKPDRRWFVRVHPIENLDAPTVADEDDRKYLVIPEIAELIPDLVKLERLYLTISRQDVLFFWPVKLPDVDGRLDTWNESALLIADQAKKEWLRVIANRPLSAYESATLAIELPDPVWPEEPLSALLRIAFRGRLIESVDHPLIQRLRGEI